MNSRDKIANHPSGISLVYNDKDHSYTDTTGRAYISATRFVGMFFPKFDAMAVSEKVAPKRKTTPEALRREWSEKGDRLRREGHHVHAYADALISGQKNWKAPDNVREAQLYRQVSIAVVSLLKKFEFVASEFIVFSPTLGIAGMIDLVMADKKTGEIVLFDWKQNLEIKRHNQWETALPPISHLENCDWAKYQLQLGTYYKIITTENYFYAPKYRAALIHLKQDYYTVLRFSDSMNTEITEMLSFGKEPLWNQQQ